MADIRNAQGCAFNAYRGMIGVWRWCPNRPLRLGGKPPAIYVPPQQIASASRRYTLCVEKTFAVEMIGVGTIVIARHQGRNTTPRGASYESGREHRAVHVVSARTLCGELKQPKAVQYMIPEQT